MSYIFASWSSNVGITGKCGSSDTSILHYDKSLLWFHSFFQKHCTDHCVFVHIWHPCLWFSMQIYYCSFSNQSFVQWRRWRWQKIMIPIHINTTLFFGIAAPYFHVDWHPLIICQTHTIGFLEQATALYFFLVLLFKIILFFIGNESLCL